MAQVVQAVVPFGKYDLVASLGRGGMAEIFLAHERGQDSFVVIKRVLPHLSTEVRFLEMLVSEAKVASLLNHPGIVRMLGLGQEEGQFYLAMEYVPGWNVLTVSKAAGGKVPPLIAAAIGQQVAEALSHAHLQTDLEGRPLNLVHRDVTPGNVMATPRGDAKLIDFGIAKAATQLTKTAPGILKGKLRFVSPEQVRQEPVDARSDLFSLGVSLYEITTGTQPFGFTHAAQTLQAILDFEPPRPRTIVPDFPEDLEAIILRALEKHPDDRYPDAKSMAADLMQVVGGDPRTDLGDWLLDLAGRKPDLLPPPRDPIGETVPLRPPARGNTRDKVKVSVETVRLPQLSEEEAGTPSSRKPELAMTRPMSRHEITKHGEPSVEVTAPKAEQPLAPPRTRTQDRRPATSASGELATRSKTAERRAADSAAAAPPPSSAAPPRSRTAERRAEAPAAAADPAVPRSRTAERRAAEISAAPPADPLPRTRTSERRSSEVAVDPAVPPAGRPRTAERRAVEPPPAAPLRSRTSDKRPVAADEASADLRDRLTPTAMVTGATTNMRSRSSDRSPAVDEGPPSAGLAERLTPTATATAHTANARPRTSDRSPAMALAALPPEDLPTKATDPEPARPRSRTSDRKPAASPVPSEAEPVARPRKPSVGASGKKGSAIPQWLVGFLLGLAGVLGVGGVAAAIYWAAVLHK
ncbi:MAG: protein kinase [Myxococcales bacterium]